MSEDGIPGDGKGKDILLAAVGSVLLHALCMAVPFSASHDIGEEGTAPDFRVIGTVCLAGDLDGSPEDGPSPLPLPAVSEPAAPERSPPVPEPSAPKEPPATPEAPEKEKSPESTEPACPAMPPPLPEGQAIDPVPIHPEIVPPEPPEPPEALAPHARRPGIENKPAHPSAPGPAGSAFAGQAGVPGDRNAARGASGGAREKYLSDLLRKLQAEKRYPAAARWNGWEGEVEVRMALGGDGGLLGVKLEKSSFHEVLDEEAQAMVRRAAPFPPLPKELGLEKWHLVIPVRFRLAEGR